MISFVVKDAGAVILLFRWENKTSVTAVYVYVNTQNVKIARRDRPHFLASRRCETFENLLHIDIAPVWSTVQHSKNVFVLQNLILQAVNSVNAYSC